MLVAFIFAHHDRELAFQNLAWTAELGCGRGHDILLVCPSGVAAADAQRAVEIAGKAFRTVTLYHLTDDCTTGWPFGPNFMWKRTVDYIEYKRLGPFLLQESDAIFLKLDSLDLIEAEFRGCGKPCLGYREYRGHANEHMNGVGVWSEVSRLFPNTLRVPWPQHASEIGPNRMSFDQAAAPEINELSKHSHLFQFQYKKEEELIRDESLSWLNPDAAIFHTCKNPRIFSLLRSRSGAVDSGASKGAHKENVSPPFFTPPRHPGMVTDVFVKTYPADTMWQEKCRQSFDNYCTGFRSFVEECSEHPTRGYLSQQIFKMNADRFTDADFILVTDSDTLWTKPATPETYMKDGKTMWFYEARENVLAADAGTAKWFACMEKFLGIAPAYEFMRRQPFMVPRWLLQAFRQFCWQRHGMSVEQYVMAQEEFSEWNCLGFYAWTYHLEAFAWMKNEEVPLTVFQFWSAHHFTPERREQQFKDAIPEIDAILNEPEAAPAAVANDGWNSINASPENFRKVMDVSSAVVKEAAKLDAAALKKQAMKDRMAKARAGKGKKK